MSPLTRTRPFERFKQSGIALITAVLMVALATILAVNVAYRGYLDQRRALTTLAFDQSYEFALGAESAAAELFAADAKQFPKYIHFAQTWSKPIKYPMPEGEIDAQIEDLGGRFNLNNLAESDPKKRQGYIAQFRNLLSILELETEWADKMTDWIDADNNITYPDGGEDDVYSAIKPPYLTANLPITRTSELLSLKGFGLERFRKLEPFVAALPPGTRINLCTAPGAVLDSFGSSLRQFSLDAKSLAQQRTSGCFPEAKVLQASLTVPEERNRVAEVTATTSEHFRLTTVVTLGSYEFTLYSHLQRSANGESTAAMLRSFGTD